jgi:hypothetical protein
LGAWGRSSPPRAVSLQAVPHAWEPLGSSSVATHGICRELLPTRVVSQACMPQFHTSQGWERVQCSMVLVSPSSQTSLRHSLVKPLNTRDHQLQSLTVDTSCLRNSLGVTLRLLGYLGYDRLSLWSHQ